MFCKLKHIHKDIITKLLSSLGAVKRVNLLISKGVISS